MRRGLPSRSRPSTTTRAGRSTMSFRPGMLRQPSSSRASSSLRWTISGLTSANGGVSRSRMSTTMTRRLMPTCGAARPTPSAAYMVSIMSSMRRRRLSSISATGSAFWRSTGSPRRRIVSSAIPLSALGLLGRGEDARDLRPRDDDARVLARLDGDAVVLHVHDLADDAAVGHDLVAALERAQHLLVPLLRLALRPDDEQPEDQ